MSELNGELGGRGPHNNKSHGMYTYDTYFHSNLDINN